MTALTNNELTDDVLEYVLAVVEDRYENRKSNAGEDDRIILALRELQKRRKASKEPVRYLNKFSGVCVTLEQQPNASDDVAVYMPLYAAPPASEREQIRRKNEPVAYLVCNGHLYQDRPFLDLSTARKSVKDRNDGAEIKALCVCEISAEK